MFNCNKLKENKQVNSNHSKKIEKKTITNIDTFYLTIKIINIQTKLICPFSMKPFIGTHLMLFSEDPHPISNNLGTDCVCTVFGYPASVGIAMINKKIMINYIGYNFTCTFKATE